MNARVLGAAWIWQLVVPAVVCLAAQPSFRIHTVNSESTYSACAAVDVNRDGSLDIVCGGWWYEAPGWKRHLLREVEQIRGRFDDYSNLPLDVDGDGWMDLVSANYRSRSLYWVRHPGAPLGTWTKHLIDTPGAMETGRLADIDQDGQLDVLPNGVQFAAWWEVTPAQPTGQAKVRWVRHDLPVEVAGHGVGFGDVNGDGRGDVVGTRGWLQAPKDRRGGRWRWWPDFQLHRDCGIPILVHDVDHDGDNDLIWGRGHGIGLYWLEQRLQADGARQWRQHAIDTSWSQAHSLLLADVDQDQQLDLIAGKRYLGHDGKDLGEFDPLVVYWYRFDPDQGSWRRAVVSEGAAVGFGLDPKAVDLDGDGDVDFLAAGRSGLYWLENRLQPGARGVEPQQSRQPDADYQPPRHSQLMDYWDARRKTRQAVSGPAQWALRRVEILRGMQQVMGPLPLPHRRTALEVQVHRQEDTPSYVRQTISFAPEKGDRVPAYLLLPKHQTVKTAAMLCLHQTTRIGKGEPAGLGGRASLHYAHELAERGYVCLVPDYPSFGDYKFDFATDGKQYVSGSMKAIWNNIRAVDLLESLPQVDPDRIGCIGHSLGGHNALFTAVFDQRLQAVVTSCGFTALHHYYGGKLAGWTSDRYMPRIAQRYGNDPDKVPFDFYEVLAALAPRAVFVNAPLGDGNFENQGVQKVMQSAVEVFTLLGAAERVKAVYPDCGHDFPDDVRSLVYSWLDAQLQ